MNDTRGFWAAVERWFHAPVPAVRLGAFRALVCAVALYDVLLYSGLVLGDAAAVSAGGPLRPWTPLYAFQLLGLGPIDLPTAEWVQAGTVLALTAGALGLGARLSCALGALGFLYWSGLAYSFGKPHHDKVALAFAVSVLPFAPVGAGLSLDALLRRWRGKPAPAEVRGTPIRFTWFALAVGYCGAGSAKILLGGPGWFNGYTLQGIMLGHDGNWSRVFAADVHLAQLQSIGVVAVQVLFPLVLFWPRARWFFLPAATGFHLMTWQTMDTGPYMRLWLLLWAFVPLEQVPTALARGLRRGVVAAVAIAVPVVLYAALVVHVASEVVPGWALGALVAALLAALVRALRRTGVERVAGVADAG
ncbi:MAG: HTTM domain-containing protein [Planctomycetes bacterium]|nr:HTTM domain-containing protein [Planctomycetota bacterium]